MSIATRNRRIHGERGAKGNEPFGTSIVVTPAPLGSTHRGYGMSPPAGYATRVETVRIRSIIPRSQSESSPDCFSDFDAALKRTSVPEENRGQALIVCETKVANDCLSLFAPFRPPCPFSPSFFVLNQHHHGRCDSTSPCRDYMRQSQRSSVEFFYG